MAGALLASLTGYLVGSFFLSVAYQFFPYILVAYTTALLAITRSMAASTKSHMVKAKRMVNPWYSNEHVTTPEASGVFT
jgi:hypothetical protein